MLQYVAHIWTCIPIYASERLCIVASILVSGTFMAVTCEVDVTFQFIWAHTCTSVRPTRQDGVRAMWTAFAVCSPYFSMMCNNMKYKWL